MSGGTEPSSKLNLGYMESERGMVRGKHCTKNSKFMGFYNGYNNLERESTRSRTAERKLSDLVSN